MKSETEIPEIWPGPMEGIGKAEFVRTVNALGLTRRWMTPFFRLSCELPRRGKFIRFLSPFLESKLPLAVQLMGSDPLLVGEAAALALECGADEINLNFGCPSRRVTGNGAGGAILRDPEAPARFALTVRRQMPPQSRLTVKMRSGWADAGESDILLPPLVSSGAVDQIFLHFRTVKELYQPIAQEERKKRFLRAVELCGTLPVIANGDLRSVEESLNLLRETGCRGIMIARPWMRDPFLLRRFEGETIDAERGRERFFAEAKRRQVARGTLLELAKMLWGTADAHFQALLTDPA